MARRDDPDPWALLKYAEHCRKGGHPDRTASLRARAAATCSPITLAALEKEMPPPQPGRPRRAREPQHQPQRSFATAHEAFLEREREQRRARLEATIAAPKSTGERRPDPAQPR